MRLDAPRSSSPIASTLCVLLALCWFLPIGAAAQLEQGTIHGTVVGPDGRPMDGVAVTLLDGLGHAVQSVKSAGGAFRFTGVAPGSYSLRAEARPLLAILPALTVRGAVPIRVELRLSAVAAEQVVVRAEQLEPG